MLNESIKMALQGMVSNKLRTFLTLLGIIIGVGAVIAMVSLGFGLKENVKSNISKLGSNLLIITSGGRTSTGARLAAGEGVKLTYDDMQAIGKQVDGIANITASVNRSYQMGKIMRINKAPFQVIGVLKSKGQGSMGMDQDDVVYVPLTTAQNRMMGITNVQRITVQAENENIINDVQADVEQVLRTRHKIKEGANDDFTVGNMAQIMETMMETANNITILLGCIAAISLLVGGIGIMNIMLVSVTERTREIGIRKALGATYNNILLQFLVESMVIGIIGGTLGVMLGIGASCIISSMAGWNTVISVWAIVIAVIFSVGIGLFFGIYPARKAALLDPIDALRYE